MPVCERCLGTNCILISTGTPYDPCEYSQCPDCLTPKLNPIQEAYAAYMAAVRQWQQVQAPLIASINAALGRDEHVSTFDIRGGQVVFGVEWDEDGRYYGGQAYSEYLPLDTVLLGTEAICKFREAKKDAAAKAGQERLEAERLRREYRG